MSERISIEYFFIRSYLFGVIQINNISAEKREAEEKARQEQERIEKARKEEEEQRIAGKSLMTL